MTSKQQENEPLSEFARDVKAGLSSSPKRLQSKYFYNAKGDELFRRIMQMEEYYLTDAEHSIFEQQKDQILKYIRTEGRFRLVELGAGDGQKTRVLLRHFQDQGAGFTYCPVDISPHVLEVLCQAMKQDMPGISIEPIVGDYFEVLSGLKLKGDMPTVVFFLGSNIGNFQAETARDFLRSIRDNLKKEDRLMIGFDLKKDPARILAAYNDPAGITRQFNLNLLIRINKELGGNFEIGRFAHYPTYDPMTGECRSYLISTEYQKVEIEALDEVYTFERWEPVFMEMSKKYSTHEIERLAHDTGFRVVSHLHDQRKWFCDSVWEVK